MRNSPFILFFLLAVSQIQAQNYQISFAGIGDTNVVTTVTVENLTSGAAVTLDGSDTLHLYSTVGIGSPPMDAGSLLLYPNPMDMQSLLVFTAPENGKTIITLVDLTGSTICKVSQEVKTGTNSFRISGISRGLYFVNVRGQNYRYTAKLLCQSSMGTEPRIDYVSAATNRFNDHLKSTAAQINMPYTHGDQLLFKGMTGIYSTIVTDVPASSKTITFNFAACTDADNNNYAIVHIGTHTWMAENLNAGIRIEGNLSQTDNSIIEKYCYNNDPANCDIYGGLYLWNEVMQYVTTPGAQGICPAGWHVPTDAEWCTFNQYLDPTVNCGVNGWSGTNAGGKIKSTGTLEAGNGLWHTPNAGATNESGFSGLAGGYSDSSGAYSYSGYYGYWWSSTELNSNNAWSRSPDFSYSSIVRGFNFKSDGYSMRCLQD